MFQGLVRKLQELSGSIHSGTSTAQYRDQLIFEANRTLAELKLVDFSDTWNQIKNLSDDALKSMFQS